MYFFTADHHFGHENIIRHAGRPFASVEEMTEELIARHNDTVSPRDQVFLLGDVGYRLPPRYLAQCLGRMRGRKLLLPGNHDRRLIHKGQRKGVFDELCRHGHLQILGDYHELKLSWRNRRLLLVLFHYPLCTWNGKTNGTWHLHGHSHGQLAPCSRRVDCGVDVWDFRPAALDAALARGLAPSESLCLDN